MVAYLSNNDNRCYMQKLDVFETMFLREALRET